MSSSLIKLLILLTTVRKPSVLLSLTVNSLHLLFRTLFLFNIHSILKFVIWCIWQKILWTSFIIHSEVPAGFRIRTGSISPVASELTWLHYQRKFRIQSQNSFVAVIWCRISRVHLELFICFDSFNNIVCAVHNHNSKVIKIYELSAGKVKNLMNYRNGLSFTSWKVFYIMFIQFIMCSSDVGLTVHFPYLFCCCFFVFKFYSVKNILQ